MNRSSKSKKHRTLVNHSRVAAAASPSVAAPPAGTAPPVPRGFVRGKVDVRKGMRPTRSQVIDAPGAAAEVKASARFSADFTEKTSPAELAQLLERASAWRTQLVAADAWREYVRDEDAAAWRALFAVLEPFKLAFAYASAKDAAIAAHYPHLARLLGVRHEAGVRAARTRAGERAKKAAPEAPSAPTPKAPAPVA
jgi:hypothetical protein